MTGRKSDPSPATLARANRQRVAAEEGARAMAEVERHAAAVRKNMERLRALREAREAEDASNAPPPEEIASKKRAKKKRIVR